MRARKITTHMRQVLYTVCPNKPKTNQVRCILTHIFLCPRNKNLFIAHLSSLAEKAPSSPPSYQLNQSQVNLLSIDCSGIAKSVLFRSSQIFDHKEKSYVNASLKDLALDLSDVVPHITRRIRRFCELKPEDVLELLLGFESEYGKVAIRARKVETLWEIFKWAGKQKKGFKHLPRSYEVMASMLIRVGMLRDVELLLAEMERKGILLDHHEIFSNLIIGYVGVGGLERAIWIFDWMKGWGLCPSLTCYHKIIDLLVEMKKTQLAHQICLERVALATKIDSMEVCSIDSVIRLLCLDGHIQEARNLVRKSKFYGYEPSNLVINDIASGYCEKQDFEDLLSFFRETKCVASTGVGNKIIHTLCRKFGFMRADMYRQELQHLGFRPDEITFGILIGWSCYEGNIKSASIYLSEILSKGLKPDVFSYNALIGGIFKKGMWEHAIHLVDDMVDSGIAPDLSTMMTLLAGYCKARRFEDAKTIYYEMGKYGVIEPLLVKDPLSQVFTILGFDPLAVKLRRDNRAELSRTEFYDVLGNGLYLDTDIEEYDKRLDDVLEGSMVPNLNRLVTKECGNGNLSNALDLINKMDRWGQNPSLSVFSVLLKALPASRSWIKTSIRLFKKWPLLADQLDQETLDLLVQEYCNKGFIPQAKQVFNGMLQRDLVIGNESYTALIKSLCKKGSVSDFHKYLAIACKYRWLPLLDDCNSLWECLCHKKMLKEATELFESMLISYPGSRLEICNIFIQKLCLTGFSCTGHALVTGLVERGCFLDSKVYNHLIKGLCCEKKFLVAFTVLDEMLACDFVPCLDVILILIPRLCRAKEFEKAFEIGYREESISVYNALIKGFCITGKVKEAKDLVRKMLMSGLLPDGETYSSLVQGYCQAKSSKEVGEILGRMIRENISMSISSYRDFVHSTCREGRFFCALSLKEIMPRENISTYNILVFYLLLYGNRSLVFSVLDELQEKGLLPDEVTYNFLVHGLCASKDLPTSLHFLSTMILKGFRPNNRSLRKVINLLCDLGEYGKAMKLSEEMESKCWVPGSIIQNALVKCLFSQGKIHEAENFLDRMVMKKLIPNAINYDDLIKSFCRLGRAEKAVELVNIMLKKGNTPDSSSYDKLINCFCGSNNLMQAIDFHTEMLDRGLKPSINSWAALIDKFCQSGRATEAERLLTSMVELQETPTRTMFTAVISRYRAENNVGKASEIIKLMQKCGYELDFETHWSLINNLNTSVVNNSSSQGFLSRLLSKSGFAVVKDSKSKAR